MSTYTAGPTTDPFAASAQAWAVSATKPAADAKMDFLTFASTLSFLVSVGQLTKEQAHTLLDWFEHEGTQPLPPMPGPDWVVGLTLYDTVRTAVRVGAATAGTDFWDGKIALVGEVLGAGVEIVHDVLVAAPVILGTAAELVHELAAVV